MIATPSLYAGVPATPQVASESPAWPLNSSRFLLKYSSACWVAEEDDHAEVFAAGLYTRGELPEARIADNTVPFDDDPSSVCAPEAESNAGNGGQDGVAVSFVEEAFGARYLGAELRHLRGRSHLARIVGVPASSRRAPAPILPAVRPAAVAARNCRISPCALTACTPGAP